MLEISTRGRYATRILISLARRGSGTVVRRQDIVADERLSVDYVEQILLRLKEAGFVRSHRGVHGGYSLAADPATISVADVLETMEGDLRVSPCEASACPRLPSCPTRPVWDEASVALRAVMTSHSIAQLAAQTEGPSRA